MPFFRYKGGSSTLFEGGYRNREKITVPNKGYGVVIMPEPVYEYPAGHPCRGCPFTFRTSEPSCLTGSYPGRLGEQQSGFCSATNPDTENCVNAFYKKILARHRAEHENRFKKSVSNKK